MKKAGRVCRILSAATAAAAVLYGAVNTVSILRAGPATSFPWWAAWYFAAVYFAPILLVEAAVCAVLHRINKRKEEKL